MNTPVWVVRKDLNDDPNQGSDQSHVRIEHLRTVEEEKDHTSPTPWLHQYVRTEYSGCSEQSSGANYQIVYCGQALKQKWSSDLTELLFNGLHFIS